ncbi:MAG: Cys-tRNA(Pro) deacylase [Bacteroidota bacterium]
MAKKTNAVRILQQQKIPHTLLEYTYDIEDLTVYGIAKANNLIVDEIFKTLVLEGPAGITVAVIPGNQELHLKALAKCSRQKKVAMLPMKELLATVGYIRGGCSPIGMKKPFPVYLAEEALAHERIYINAGQRGLFIHIAPQDLLRVTKANAVAITA